MRRYRGQLTNCSNGDRFSIYDGQATVLREARPTPSNAQEGQEGAEYSPSTQENVKCIEDTFKLYVPNDNTVIEDGGLSNAHFVIPEMEMDADDVTAPGLKDKTYLQHLWIKSIYK